MTDLNPCAYSNKAFDIMRQYADILHICISLIFQIKMLKQMCTYLGYSGTFAKLNHTLHLLRASGIIRLQQQRHCDSNSAKCKFSTSTEAKSKQPLFDKEELAEWSDWLSDNRRSHVTKKDHVTRQSGNHGNKALHIPVMVEEVKNIFDEIKPKVRD